MYLVAGPEKLCYFTKFGQRVSGGCNGAADFFHGSPVVAGLSQEKSGATRTLTVAGVARSDISTVTIAVGDSIETVAVGRDGGFRSTPTEVAEAAVPRGVVITATGRAADDRGSLTLPTG